MKCKLDSIDLVQKRTLHCSAPSAMRSRTYETKMPLPKEFLVTERHHWTVSLKAVIVMSYDPAGFVRCARARESIMCTAAGIDEL